MASTDLYALNRTKIDAFIASAIQPDSNYLHCCGSVIDELVRYLQQLTGALCPRRIIKSGSFGKGTAVRGRSDIDLVMMLNSFSDVSSLMEAMPDVLSQLKSYISNRASVIAKSPTRFSVPSEVRCGKGHIHNVDILPAVDLLGQGKSPSDVYRVMRGQSADMTHEFSVSLAPLQLEIVGDLPPKVKDLIRLMKYWKDYKLKKPGEPEMSSFADRRDGNPKWPSSYALELVVMDAWSKSGKPVNFDTASLLKAVLRSIVNHASLSITLPEIKRYRAEESDFRSPPYIMDPANPFNDMYHGLVDGKAFDWELTAKEARTWLAQSLFQGIP